MTTLIVPKHLKEKVEKQKEEAEAAKLPNPTGWRILLLRVRLQEKTKALQGCFHAGTQLLVLIGDLLGQLLAFLFFFPCVYPYDEIVMDKQDMTQTEELMMSCSRRHKIDLTS